MDQSGATMLSSSKVTANIPASDLGRAREFYADKLGVTPSGLDELAAGSCSVLLVGRLRGARRCRTDAGELGDLRGERHQVIATRRRERDDQPHTSSAVSTISASLANCSSRVSELPS